MLQHYVEYLRPGAFDAAYYAEKIDHSDPYRVPMKDGCVGFHLYDREEVMKNGELLQGPVKNRTGVYYQVGEVCSLEQARQHPRSTRILIENMVGNKWNHVIFLPGTTYYFDSTKDVLLKDGKAVPV